MPAKPGLMPRLMTITVRALSTSELASENGARGIGAGGGVGYIVGPDDERTSVCAKSPLISSISIKPVLERRLARRSFMVAGHASGDGVDGKFYLAPFLVRASYISRTLCCAWGDSHAVSGRRRRLVAAKDAGASSACATGPFFCSPVAAAEAWTWPKAPKRTLENDRFIAFDIMNGQNESGRPVERTRR